MSGLQPSSASSPTTANPANPANPANALFIYGAENFKFAQYCIDAEVRTDIEVVERLSPDQNNWRVEFSTHEAADLALTRAKRRVADLRRSQKRALWITWHNSETSRPARHSHLARWGESKNQNKAYRYNSSGGVSLPTNP